MDKDNSSEIEKEEEEYEVEKIVGHNINKTKKSKKFVYNIKWLNYEDSENTWEKEDNVYAVDMIAQYWSKFPKSNEDRKTFELMQSKKKNPIRLSSPPPPKVAKVITASSPSPPASPTLQPSAVAVVSNEPEPVTTTTLTEAPKHTVVEPPKIASSFANFFSFKRKDPRVSSAVASTSTTTATVPAEPQQSKISEVYKITEPASTTIITATRKCKEKDGFSVPKVIDRTLSSTAADNDNFTPAEVDSSSSSDSNEEEETQKYVPEDEHIKINDAKDVVQLSSSEEEEEEEEEEPAKRETRSANRKRTRSTYTDYFTEQHKKRRMEEGNTRRLILPDNDDDEEDEIESVSSSRDDDKVKETEDDAIVFDEAFGKDPDMDWDTLAQKVEYIGRELEKSPIYCAVRWKDGERSIHSLELVRKKRPDLVIDALLALVYP